MRFKLGFLIIVLISVGLISCGPKAPDASEVQRIVAKYLQKKSPSMIRIDSIEITKIEKDSDSCTVYFEGVFTPTESAKRNVGRFVLGAMSGQSDFLELRLTGIEDQASVDAFMNLDYADGKWELSKHFSAILIPAPGR